MTDVPGSGYGATPGTSPGTSPGVTPGVTPPARPEPYGGAPARPAPGTAPSVGTPATTATAPAAPAAPAAQPAAASRTAAGAAAAQPLRTPGKSKRARLVVRRVDPWSVLKFSLLFSLCLLVVFVVAVAALYFALDALGVFDSVNQFVRDVTQANAGGKPTGGIDVTFSAGRIIGGAVVIGLINVVIITAISTLGAFLYNLCSDIVGGIEVTLGERE